MIKLTFLMLSILVSKVFSQNQKTEDLPVVSFDANIEHTTDRELLSIRFDCSLPFESDKEKAKLKRKLRTITGVELYLLENDKIIFRYPEKGKPRSPNKVTEEVIKILSQYYRHLAFESAEDDPP